MVYAFRRLLPVFIVFSCTLFASGDVQNHPDYPVAYLEDDCQPYYGDKDNGTNWNKRYLNLSEPGSKLYGYVKVTEKDAYKQPNNCAIKIIAPEGHRIIVRIPRIEIYHDDTGCDHDFMSVIGDTNALHYCGFGTVGHSIGSTKNWIIVRIKVSPWDANHNYMGFSLYYTALHNGQCDTSRPNGTEWECRTGYCIPSELTCDDRDNCGNWDDERVRVCGLSRGAIIAICVVCILIGGTVLFFVGYCLYSRYKEKRIRRQRGQEINPTVSVGSNGTSRNLTVLPSSGGVGGGTTGSNNRQAEPPPPYTPVAYINIGLYTGDEQGEQGQGQENTTEPAVNPSGQPTAPPVPTANLSVRLTNASSLRPAIGEPPPLYSANGGAVGDEATGNNTQSGVSFDPLPDKPDE